MRHMDVEDTGAPISIKVGNGTLGRLVNVLGDPMDNLGLIQSKKEYPIHRDPPSFTQQEVETRIFETGIKAVDLLAPFPKGGKVGLFGGAV